MEDGGECGGSPTFDFSDQSMREELIQKQAGYAAPGMEDGGECGGSPTFDFSDQSIRKGFIRKVYSILMCQLLVTVALIALFVFYKPASEWALTNPWIFWVAIAVTFVCLIAMSFSNLRRSFPVNFIFLAIFTLAQSFLLAVISSLFEVKEVMIAVGITAAVCLALTLFAFQTKWDFTTMGGILLAGLVVLLVFGIITMFNPNNIVNYAYAALAVFLFSCYLVYDTQLMMGGDHTYSFSPEEYIFGALSLYLDIINIFLYVLRILGGR